MRKKILISLLITLSLASLWATEKVNLSTLPEGGITITNTEERLDLTGSYSGCVTIHSDSDFILVLDNVDITSETSAIFFEGNARNIVIFIKGTNNLETIYSSNKVKQATLELCSENTVTTSIFTGNGTLNIISAKNHGIHVQEAVINSGIINIEVQETSAGHGIKAEDNFIINDVKLNIQAMGNTQENKSKGIEINGQYAVFYGGLIDINSEEKAIHVNHIEIHGGLIIAQSLQDNGIQCNNDILISGGTVIAFSDKSPFEPIHCVSRNNFRWSGGDIIAIGGSSDSFPPGYGLGIGYYKHITDLTYFGYRIAVNVINSETKDCLFTFSIPKRFSDYIKLDIFVGSDKSNGFCDVIFSVEEN